MWDFKPDTPAAATVTVPYIEDADGKSAPFYSSKKTIEQAKADMVEWLEVLGGSILSVQSGTYQINKQTRLGFIIRFSLNVAPFDGAEGQYRVVGLPMRTPTLAKEKQVRVQALLNVAEQFKTAHMSRIFSPDAHPLVPHLLVPGKDGVLRTVTETFVHIAHRPIAPELGSGS